MTMAASPWSAGELGAAFLMWTVMMAAMMLPSLVPTLRLVGAADRRAVEEGAVATPPALFALGYLFSWTAFSAFATVFQALLRSLSLLTPGLSVSDPQLGGAMLVLAGTYQLTPWKGHCLAHCRNPLSFLLTHWREGSRGALAMGMRHGLTCVACCWALMLVLFVVGVMHLAWVAVLAVAILIEKAAPGGRWVSRVAGAGLTCWGLFVLATDARAQPAATRSAASQSAATQPAIWKQRVEFGSGKLTLVGYLFRPAGPGPFKGLIWNHGSEKSPGTMWQYDSAAAVFVPAGYVVFAPMRRGHGDSEGPYVVDETQRERQTRGADAANRLVVRLLETDQLDDQLAGLRYLKTLAYVDTTRLVVAGCSYGGIQTLLGAERGAGYKAAVSISPAALSWNGNPLLRERLLKAVRGINIPVFLLQPPKDTSLEPSRVLGAEFERLHKAYKGKIYPTDIPEELQVHCFGGARGDHIWAADVLAFLEERVR